MCISIKMSILINYNFCSVDTTIFVAPFLNFNFVLSIIYHHIICFSWLLILQSEHTFVALLTNENT